MKAIKKWFDRTDIMKYWVRMTFGAFIAWGISGLLSLINGSPEFSAVVSMLGGVASCWILASAVLAVTEKRFPREAPGVKQQKTENRILFFGLVLQICAELVNVLTGNISYALPLTLAMLAFFGCARIAMPYYVKEDDAPDKKKEKMGLPEILRVLFLATVGCMVIMMFLRMTVDVFTK